MNLDRYRYGSTIQILATIYRTVDQEVSIYSPEKNLEGFKQVQTRSISLDLERRQHTDRTGLFFLEGRLGQIRDLEYHTDFLQQDPIRGLVALIREQLVLRRVGRCYYLYLVYRTFQKLYLLSYINLPHIKYTLFKPDPSSLSIQFDRQINISSGQLIETILII